MVQIIKKAESNRVAELFSNRTVFITGATGFLGKVLIEKLLRSCPKVKKIYVLIRVKKGKSGQERLREVFSGPLYDMVRQQFGKSIFDKVEVISGDVESADLSISPEDRTKIVEEVDIIYHSAATVQFDEPFKKTVLINVRGTKLMLALAKECKKLMAYCHLSTAYCQENQKVLYEKTYPPPADPHNVISMCEWMSEETLDVIGDRIRGWSANNYTFTKALGEGLVAEQMDRLPIFIFRPSAVIPIWKDPLPGWTDNVNGPMGLLLGAGKGVLRTMYGRPDYFADYVSVDCVANALMCCAYDYVTHGTRRIYNVTASDEVKVTFQQLVDVGRNIVTTEISFDWMLWYPGGSITTSRLYHYFRFLAFQLLPAIFIDIILVVAGFKPFLVRVQKKILRGYKIFEYYANSKWDFRRDNSTAVRALLNSTELEVYKVDAKNLDMHEYCRNCVLGARRYLMNEKDENIPKALIKMKVLWFLDTMFKFLFMLGFLYLLYRKFVVPFF